jgi:hypothetical protein
LKYSECDAGVPRKFVIDPHASIPRHGVTTRDFAVLRDGAVRF